MSGIEVVGLILGALPLIISGTLGVETKGTERETDISQDWSAMQRELALYDLSGTTAKSSAH